MAPRSSTATSSSTRYASSSDARYRTARKSSRLAAEPDDSKRRCCGCHPCFFILAIIAMVIAGGLLIWKYLPQDQKNSIQGVVETGTSGLTGGSSSNNNTSGDGSLGTPPTFDYYRCSSNSSDNCCNGVDTICDLKASEVMYAGLHNAYATVEDGFLLAGNHEYDLESALQAGFRAINLDLGNCNGELVFVHSKCELGKRDPYTVFDHINLFLDKHPRDLVLIPLEIENDIDGPVDLWAFYNNILSAVPGFTDRMYAHNETQYWPTMRELIDSDKRIIMFVYNAGVICRYPGNCPPGFHDWFLYASETAYEFQSVEDLQTTALACPYDRGDQGYKDFYAINAFVTDPLPSKASSAIINQPDFLQTHLSTCESIVGRNASVVFVDFWEEGDVVDLVQTHNQQLGRRR